MCDVTVGTPSFRWQKVPSLSVGRQHTPTPSPGLLEAYCWVVALLIGLHDQHEGVIHEVIPASNWYKYCNVTSIPHQHRSLELAPVLSGSPYHSPRELYQVITDPHTSYLHSSTLSANISNMRSAIITAVLALAYGITAATAAAAVATPSLDSSGSGGSLEDQCVPVGWQCSPDGHPAPKCCPGLRCWSNDGLPVGVSFRA